MKLLSLLFLLVPPYAPSWCPAFSVKVVRVVDGDTIIVQAAGNTYSLRLSGIDAPEISQVCDGMKIGEVARDKLSSLLGETLQIEVLGKDIYGRTLVSLPQAFQLVESGWAVPYQMAKYSDLEEKRRYFSAFYQAYSDERGMFLCKKLMNPLFYRKKFKSKLK